MMEQLSKRMIAGTIENKRDFVEIRDSVSGFCISNSWCGVGLVQIYDRGDG